MGVFDLVRRKAYQRTTSEEQRKQNIKQAIVQLMTEGKDVEGVLMIFLKQGKIYVMEGGLTDDFEAQVFLQRAEYLINRDGLVMP